MLDRWAHWLGNAMDYDGFRLDAGKHVVREFYGGPASRSFLHEAQWNFDQRRGNTYDANVPDLYKNETRRKDMLMFNEIFAGGSSNFDYWRQGNVKMRYLDFPAKQQHRRQRVQQWKSRRARLHRRRARSHRRRLLRPQPRPARP